MSLLKGKNLINKRLDNESFEDYKIRRAENKKLLKFYLKGEIVWESKKQGVFIIKNHGEKI